MMGKKTETKQSINPFAAASATVCLRTKHNGAAMLNVATSTAESGQLRKQAKNGFQGKLITSQLVRYLLILILQFIQTRAFFRG